jgi:hypothetical protein
MEEDSMKKLLIGTALLFAALPFTLDGVAPTVSKAQAAYRGIHHRHVVLHRRPVLAAAAVGAAATGPSWGWGGWNWNSPLYMSAVGVGGPGIGMGAAGCYPTFDYSTGFNQFCLGRGFLWGTGQIHQ